MIETRNISKAYGAELVVADVSLKLPAGGVTSIIGPNGAGKSTLLSMISRLLPISAGSALVDGLDVTATRHSQAGQPGGGAADGARTRGVRTLSTFEGPADGG